jgi:hypothetical protein
MIFGHIKMKKNFIKNWKKVIDLQIKALKKLKKIQLINLLMKL